MPGGWYRLGLCRLELYLETMLGPGIIEVSLPEQEGFSRREFRAEPHKQAAIAAFRRYAQLRGVKEESSPHFRCSQAAIAIAEGRHDEAEKICNDLLAASKTDEQVWLLKAMARCSRKDYAGAIEVLEVLINEVMPQLSQAHYLLGWIREKQQNFPAAMAACSRALELNPSCIPALVTRAWAKCGMDDEAGMIEDAARAIELDPACAPAYYARGWLRERRKDLKGAAEDYGKIVDLHPTYAPVYHPGMDVGTDGDGSGPSRTTQAISPAARAGDCANCARVRAHLTARGGVEDYTRAIRGQKPEAGLHERESLLAPSSGTSRPFAISAPPSSSTDRCRTSSRRSSRSANAGRSGSGRGRSVTSLLRRIQAGERLALGLLTARLRRTPRPPRP
jgi:tetratricopeptide (TPR) repeat protein